MTEPGVLEVSVHVAAQPTTVFAYFTDPARYAQRDRHRAGWSLCLGRLAARVAGVDAGPGPNA